MTETEDPRSVQTAAVTAADLVSALEANHRRSGESVVLRITPPFSGRMRARIHRSPQVHEDESAPIVLAPESLVDEKCPLPPEPDDVEDSLRSNPEEAYTIDGHRERYEAALQCWRATVLDHVRDSVSLADGGTEIAISVLGTIDEA